MKTSVKFYKHSMETLEKLHKCSIKISGRFYKRSFNIPEKIHKFKKNSMGIL